MPPTAPSQPLIAFETRSNLPPAQRRAADLCAVAGALFAGLRLGTLRLVPGPPVEAYQAGATLPVTRIERV